MPYASSTYLFLFLAEQQTNQENNYAYALLQPLWLVACLLYQSLLQDEREQDTVPSRVWQRK